MSLLPGLTQSAPGVPIFSPASGGGGGGGGGPNPSFSTININPAGAIIMNTDAGFDTPNLQFNVSADGTLSENFLFRNVGTGNIGNDGKFLALMYFTPAVNLGGVLGVGGLNFSSQFEGEAGAGVIGLGTGGTSIYLEGVSTINGAAPGGGGSVGPNPIFSTITLSADSNDNNLLTTQGLKLATITNSNDRIEVWGGSAGSSNPGTGQQMGVQCFFSNGAQGSLLFGDANGNESALTLLNYDLSTNIGANLSTVIYGGVQILPGQATGGSLYVPSTNTQVVNIEDFNNPGQYPYRLRANSGSARVEKQDGSLGDLSVSTLTVSSMNTIAVLDSFTFADTANTTQGAIFQVLPSDANLYQIAVTDSNAAFVTGINIGLTGGRNQVYIDSNAQIGNQLWVSSIQNCSEAFVSSFNVSSINGAAPGGGGGFTAQKLSWTGSGSNILGSNGTPGSFSGLTSASAPVVDGHTYRVTATFGLSNTVADGNTEIVIEGGGVGGLPATISVSPNIVTGAQVPFAGLSGYFTVAGTSGGGVRVSGVNTGSADTIVFNDSDFVILEDLGIL